MFKVLFWLIHARQYNGNVCFKLRLNKCFVLVQVMDSFVLIQKQRKKIIIDCTIVVFNY